MFTIPHEYYQDINPNTSRGEYNPWGFGIKGILRGAEPHPKTQSHGVHLNPCTLGCGCVGITAIAEMMQLLGAFQTGWHRDVFPN